MNIYIVTTPPDSNDCFFVNARSEKKAIGKVAGSPPAQNAGGYKRNELQVQAKLSDIRDEIVKHSHQTARIIV